MTRDCQTAQRAILTEPRRRDAIVDAHVAQCPACAALRQEMLAFEATLHEAVSVAVPDGLESRVLLRQSFQRQRGWYRTSVAAGLAAAAAAIMLVALLPRPLPADVMTHVETYTLVQVKPVDRSTVEQIVGRTGAHFVTPLVPVTYAKNCTIRGETAAHLVLQGGDGPITVFVMPRVRIDGDSEFRAEGLSGKIVRFGNGSIAIIGADQAYLERVRPTVTAMLSPR